MTEKINFPSTWDFENALNRWIGEQIPDVGLKHDVRWAVARIAGDHLRAWLACGEDQDGYAAYLQTVESDYPGLTPLDFKCWVEWQRAKHEIQPGYAHSWFSYYDDLVDSALRCGHSNGDDFKGYVSHYPNNCRCGDDPHLGRVVYKHTIADGCTGPFTLEQVLERWPDWHPTFAYEMGEPEHPQNCLCHQWSRWRHEQMRSENVV